MTAPTDEVTWVAGYGPAEVFGLCQHECDHKQRASIADGPDVLRTSLMVCVTAACRTNPSLQCRAWTTKSGAQWGPWRAVWVGNQKPVQG